MDHVVSNLINIKKVNNSHDNGLKFDSSSSLDSELVSKIQSKLTLNIRIDNNTHENHTYELEKLWYSGEYDIIIKTKM